MQTRVVEESSSSEQEQEVEDEVEAVECQESPEEKLRDWKLKFSS